MLMLNLPRWDFGDILFVLRVFKFEVKFNQSEH